MREKQIIYYEDELNEEFSAARITPRRIDEKFVYLHGRWWDALSRLIQNVLSMPIKLFYAKLKFHVRYVGKEKLKPFRREGYFLYGNHTQPFADTFLPSLAMYPKRNFFIVNPENVSMRGLGTLVELLGAIPIPCDMGGMKHFLKAIESRIHSGYAITIYPEAHIWPYYTGIRPFKDVSFRYPVQMKTPVFCLTNTYQAAGRHGDKVKIVTYIDGPFYADESLDAKKARKQLRNQVYLCMKERSQKSNIQVIEYRKKQKTL
jgi:1-acyl-sn-glycerol-3-phosphate acyltransferase